MCPLSADRPHLHSFPTRRSSDLKITGHRINFSQEGEQSPAQLHSFDRLGQPAVPNHPGAAGSESDLFAGRSEEHTSELQSPCNLVCRLLLEKKTITYC